MPQIPLVEELTDGPIPAGSILIVEFAGGSQWHNVSLAIASGWLKQGGSLSYNCHSRFPDVIRTKLARAGLNIEALESGDKLRIWDWYAATLGKKSPEKYAYDSLKVADLSIRFAREDMGARTYQMAGWIRIADNISAVARFNDEKTWVEFFLTRAFPSISLGGRTTTFNGVLKEVHSKAAYEQLEAAADGIIDFKLEEEGKTTRDLVRIRTMRDVGFDREWHELKIGENLEITLQD